MKMLDRVPEFAPLIVNPYETILGVAKVCLVASQATIVTLTPADTDKPGAVRHMTLIQPCRAKSDVMNSIFYERAWERVREFSVWSRLG
jgi:hypothetical protein